MQMSPRQRSSQPAAAGSDGLGWLCDSFVHMCAVRHGAQPSQQHLVGGYVARCHQTEAAAVDGGATPEEAEPVLLNMAERRAASICMLALSGSSFSSTRISW